jgi:uncharacterized protein YukE
MSRRPWVLFAAVVLSLFSASAPFAQDASPGGPADSPPAPSGTNDSPASKAPQNPKRVWTNDDLAGFRANSTISTVGDDKNVTRRSGTRRTSSDYLARRYRAQIDQLQAQLADIDKQIANLRGALSGKTVDSTRKYEPLGGKIGDWKSQMDQLQKNRQNLLRQIDALETQMRQSNP